MNSEYMLPLKLQEEQEDSLIYRLILNEQKEIVWVNEKAERYLQFDLRIEHHLDSEGMEGWHKYLNKLKQATMKKSYVSLLDKRKKVVHYIAYGMYDQWNKTYVIDFRQVSHPLRLNELYDKTFKILDSLHIGAFASPINGFIFLVNETAKHLVPNACQMSIRTLLRRYFDNDQFGHYIKLLNKREPFSADVICNRTHEHYRLMYQFDSEFELDVMLVQHLLFKDLAEQRTKLLPSIDKQTAASIVHEIRNPLTTLQGFVDLMKVDEVSNTQYLQMLDHELRRMEQLLSGMLQYFKPKIQCLPIECNRFLNKILLLFEADVKSKNICLVYGRSSDSCYMLANEHSLTQVFMNLIKNSMQAMETNGSITITFNKYEHNELEICIKDLGNGMSEEQIKNMFTPYYTTKENGTGLGLVIVKKLMEEMGGRIEVQSMLGHGTSVYLYLQLASACDCSFTN